MIFLFQNITLRNLPAPLASDLEFFHCVFGRFGSGNLTAINGDTYSCDVPQIALFQDEGMSFTHTTYTCMQVALISVDFSLHISSKTAPFQFLVQFKSEVIVHRKLGMIRCSTFCILHVLLP